MEKEIFQKKIEVLLEAYKMITEESKIYLAEIFKCFIYAAIIVAIFLGGEVGLFNTLNIKIREYVPFALIILILYFLSLAFNYSNILRYRGFLERKINTLLEDRILDYDSYYKKNILTTGLVEINSRWHIKLPSPNFLLGILIFATLVILFRSSETLKNNNISTLLLVICGIIAFYVYMIYPNVIRKKIDKEFDK